MECTDYTNEMTAAGWEVYELANQTVLYRTRIDRPNIGPDWVFVSTYNGGWLPSMGAHPASLGSMDWKGQVYDTPVAAMVAGHLANWGRP